MRSGRKRIVQAIVAVVVTAGTTLACGTGSTAAPPARPGQAAGTGIVASATDVAGTVKAVQNAITAGGGTVVATIDHAADGRAAGVEVPANTLVIGGTPADRTPLLRVNQLAGAAVPPGYLVRQGPDGVATVTYDSADYLAAVSGVSDPAASTALSTDIATVVTSGTSEATLPFAAPLLGVTPVGYLISIGGDTTPPAALSRLRNAADRGQSTVVATIDLVAGAGPGPAIRPTTAVLVSTPATAAPLIAAAPTFGLEMPMRYLVWLDVNNQTFVGYPDVRRLAARHGIPADDPNVVRMAADADRIAKIAAGTAA